MFLVMEAGFQLCGQLSKSNLCLVINKSQFRGRIVRMTPTYLCLCILIT